MKQPVLIVEGWESATWRERLGLFEIMIFCVSMSYFVDIAVGCQPFPTSLRRFCFKFKVVPLQHTHLRGLWNVCECSVKCAHCISPNVFHVCLLWETNLTDNTLRVCFKLKQNCNTWKRKLFGTDISAYQTCAHCLCCYVHVHLECCLDGVVSHKCIYKHMVFVVSTRCLWIILCLRVFVCMAFHSSPLCAAVLVWAFVTSYDLVVVLQKPVLLSVNASGFFVLFLGFFSSRTALYVLLCYLCFQLLFAWHPAVGILLFSVLNHASCEHGLYPPPVYINQFSVVR